MHREDLKWLRFCMIALMLLTTFAVSWSFVAHTNRNDVKWSSGDVSAWNPRILSSQQALRPAVLDDRGKLLATQRNVKNSAIEQTPFAGDDKMPVPGVENLAHKPACSDMEFQTGKTYLPEGQATELTDYSGLLASISEVTGRSIPFEPEFSYPIDQAARFAGISASPPSAVGGSKSEKISYSAANPKASQTQKNENGLVIGPSEKDGIRVEDAWHDGVNVLKAHRGLNVERAYGRAVNVGFAHDDGFHVDSADVNGMDIDHVGDDGIQIFRAGRDGLVIYNAGEEGIDAIGNRGNLLRTNSPNFYGLYVYSHGASPSNPGLYVAGTFYATGTKSSVVQTSRGDEALYALESPEVEFMASGTARLADGECYVPFDRLFREAISSQIPLRIILTPKDTWTGLYVAEKSHRGFRVKAAGGEINAEFDWLAIGRRKGYEKRPDSPFLDR